MEKLLESTDKKGDFCFLANIKTYLSKFNIHYEEYWLGGMVGVMGFYFTTLKTGIPSVINGRSKEFEGLYEDFTEYFLEPLHVERFRTKIDVLHRIDELLDTHILPMMWIDEYYLPEAFNYQKNHLWVMAVILESSNTELIIFNNEEIRISKTDMDLIMYKEGFIEIQYTLSNEIKWKYSETEMAIRGLQRVANNISKNTEAQEEYYGLCGMKHFLSVFQESRNYEKIYNYFYEMNRGGGLYKTRRNMKLFLEEILQRWSCEEANVCIIIYQQLEEKWTKITNLLFKLSVVKDLKLQNRITNRIEEVISLEELGMKEIGKLTEVLLKKRYEEK